jgi:histidyl-tRNA synthetase
MFRHEQPQAGRYRAFHQFGFEIMGGASDPIYDAQIILASIRLIEELKIKNLTLQINSIGCRVCRPHFKKRLVDYYRRHERKLCGDCKRRLKTNPLRLLDCKNEECVALKTHAPNLMDNLCSSCNTHFKSVIEYLDELALPYTLNPYLVRGLDYYNKTVFEVFADGYQHSIAAGGRYDYLFEMIGGRPTPGVGSALGLERLIEVMRLRNIELTPKNKAKVFLMYIGDLAKKKVLKLVEEFRDKGIHVRESFGKDLLKKQMQLADKDGAALALILGQKEVYEESIIIRDLVSGTQESVPLKRVVEEVKKRLK